MTAKEVMLKDLQLAIEWYTEILNEGFKENRSWSKGALQFVKKQLLKYKDYPEDAEIFVTWMLVDQKSIHEIERNVNLTKSQN